MNRRDFIYNTCLTCAAGIGLSSFLSSCTTHKYVSVFKEEPHLITLNKSELYVLKNGKTIKQKFVLLKPKQCPFPLAVYEPSPNEFKAILLKCSHQGCELNAFETTMVCPCHGAEFNNKGEVTQGPAEKNLTTFVTTSDPENIYIQLT